jgi:DNA invertase Pin-like site-specific DNA recombinase
MEGIERAKLNGKYKGRNGGTIETPEKFMGKEKIQKVMIELLNGKRSSVISTEINIHMNTITKIKKYMKRYPELVPSV